jgi:hypothetical protein
MKLTRIEVQNFRCFERASFDLMHPSGDRPLDVVLLVGPNGSGKTAVLRAIARFFTALRERYAGGELQSGDIRQGADCAEISVHLVDTLADGRRCEIKTRGLLLSRATKWLASDRDPRQRVMLRKLGAYLVSAGGEVPVELSPGFHLVEASPTIDEWLASIDETPGAAGLMAAFGAHRALAVPQLSGPRRDDALAHRCSRSLRPLSGNIEPYVSHAIELAQWMVNVDFRRARAKADRGIDFPLWGALKTGLDHLLAPYAFEGIDDDFRVLFRTPRGVLPLEDLSQGFGSVFLIIGEILLRASLAARHPEHIFEQEMVCLIDEIDAHLHPRWQETVIAGLRSLFPRLQIIATTHSPFVVSSVAPCNVFRLEEV